MTLESGDNQALFGGKLLGNNVAVVVLGGGSVGGDIVLHLGILEENDEQAVATVELLQVRKLAKHGRHALRQHAEREIPLHSDKGLSALRFGGDLVATDSPRMPFSRYLRLVGMANSVTLLMFLPP